MRLTLLALCLLAACAEVPDLGDRIPAAERSAPAPDLVPLQDILAQAQGQAPIQTAAAAAAGISGRVSGLQARAAALRGAVLSPADRARIARGVDTSFLN